MPHLDTVTLSDIRSERERATLTPYGARRFAAENRQKVMTSVKALSTMAAVIIPLFSLLDYFMYPGQFAVFLGLRMLCVVFVLLALFCCSKTKWGKSHYRAFTVIIPLIPAFFIAVMIFLSLDANTTYYVGMILCIVVIGFVSHWTHTEALISSSLVILFYFVAIAPPVFNGLETREQVMLISNCIFAVAFGAVITIGTYLHQRIRIDEFRSREKVRQQQIKLESKNAELARMMRELREAEDQLIQSEKMASLGQLSAGMIHEIGNPLNYSNQALFLLRRLVGEQGPESPIGEAIEDIQDSIDRMKDIVTELRDFSHKSNEDRAEFRVKEPIQIALKMLGKEIEDEGVIVTAEVEPGLQAFGVKNQITQVLINLVHNAIHAVAKSGENELKRVNVVARSIEGHIEISIWDNGPGISSEKIKKIFDPFFTTKEVGEGTGLGLSICYRIVEAHQGALNVTSEEGSHTEFTIVLPLPPESPSQPPISTSKPSPHHEPAIS